MLVDTIRLGREKENMSTVNMHICILGLRIEMHAADRIQEEYERYRVCT